MDDSVLRGFCQKCEWPIYLENKGAKHLLLRDSHKDDRWPDCGLENIKPVWFLSPKQIEILAQEKQFGDWILKQNKGVDFTSENLLNFLSKFLEKEPFLVARILKEAGEKDE